MGRSKHCAEGPLPDLRGDRPGPSGQDPSKSHALRQEEVANKGIQFVQQQLDVDLPHRKKLRGGGRPPARLQQDQEPPPSWPGPSSSHGGGPHEGGHGRVGIWKEEEASLPPIAMKYVRSTLHGKLSGGALREVMTLASMLDLMMMGRVSEAADLGMQRLKSIERVSQGSTWASTEKLELIGTLAPQISTRAEMSVAAKELKLEHQVKGGASLYKGKGVGAPDSKGKKGKVEDKGKGKRTGEGDRGFKEKKDK